MYSQLRENPRNARRHRAAAAVTCLSGEDGARCASGGLRHSAGQRMIYMQAARASGRKWSLEQIPVFRRVSPATGRRWHRCVIDCVTYAGAAND